MRRIYLDHNATTPLDPRVREAITPWLDKEFGNPSSLHAEGRAARRAIEDAREQVALALGAEPREVVFTSGATEANNTAIANAAHLAQGRPPRLAVSAVEHPSVLEPARELAARGARLSLLGVDGLGILRDASLEAALAEGPDLVAVIVGNNEVGSVQPWAAVAARCREAGVPFHLDAVQALGKVPFSVAGLGPGTAAISGHKIGGPKGVGALWVGGELRVSPRLVGGGQERRRRAGTENVAAIVGLGEACCLAVAELEERRRRLSEAERVFLEALRACRPGLRVHGPGEASRLPGTLSLRIPGCPAESVMFGLDLAGVSVSVGAACSSGAVQPSHVLEAMGIGKVENLETFRVSLGWSHAPEELRRAAEVLDAVAARCLGS